MTFLHKFPTLYPAWSLAKYTQTLKSTTQDHVRVLRQGPSPIDIVFSNYNRRQGDRRLVVIFGCLLLDVFHITDHAAVLQNAH